ncbi:hypothetical protein HY374_01745 [Candidatus Berkelbacteria bacterium]|nr:hypothetical protein [Candidatus Berkelbacteria bacterium]
MPQFNLIITPAEERQKPKSLQRPFIVAVHVADHGEAMLQARAMSQRLYEARKEQPNFQGFVAELFEGQDLIWRWEPDLEKSA